MKRIILIILFFTTSFAFTQNVGLLWKISHPNNKDTSYIFGTMHQVPNDFKIPVSCYNSILKSKVILKESNSNNAFLTLFYFRSLMKIMFNPKAKKIEDFVSITYSDSLKKHIVNKYKINISNYNIYSRFRPIIFENMINPTTNNHCYHLDDSLMKISKNNNLKVKYLESIRDIANSFRKIPVKDEAYLIFGKSEDFTDTSIYSIKEDVYFKGQSDDFFMKKNSEMSISEKIVFSALILDRNTMWLDRMERQMKKKPTFIAVGLGHLLPENYGLIDILRAKGYTVECILKEFN